MSEPFLGQIQAFGFNFAPRGWAKCDGQLLAIAQYNALFALLGTIYGGDGRTTFALPDLRGRTSLHEGNGPGLSDRRIGQKSGQENVTLNINDIPGHHHSIQPAASGVEGGLSSPANNFPGELSGAYSSASNTQMGSFNSGTTGGGQGHNNMQPYLVINWCIALTGIFPSRS